MKAKHTPIEEWIEEDTNKWFTKARFNSNHIADFVSYIDGIKSTLTYLGLQGIDNPKSWIEEYKTMESLHKESSHQIRMLMDENLKLQAENLKLRNCGNCKHEYRAFKEGTPCLGCCSSEHDFSNWEGKL